MKRKSIEETTKIESLPTLFENPLKLVEAINPRSTKEVAKHFDIIRVKLAEKSDWDDKVYSIKLVMSLLKGNGNQYPDFDISFVCMSLPPCVTDSRSSLVKWGTLLIAALAQVYKSNFAPYVPVLLTALFKPTTNGTAIIAQCCRHAIHQISIHVQAKRTVSELNKESLSASFIHRSIVAESLQFCSIWASNNLQNLSREISSTLHTLKSDQSQKVRDIARGQPLLSQIPNTTTTGTNNINTITSNNSSGFSTPTSNSTVSTPKFNTTKNKTRKSMYSPHSEFAFVPTPPPSNTSPDIAETPDKTIDKSPDKTVDKSPDKAVDKTPDKTKKNINEIRKLKNIPTPPKFGSIKLKKNSKIIHEIHRGPNTTQYPTSLSALGRIATINVHNSNDSISQNSNNSISQNSNNSVSQNSQNSNKESSMILRNSLRKFLNNKTINPNIKIFPTNISVLISQIPSILSTDIQEIIENNSDNSFDNSSTNSFNSNSNISFNNKNNNNNNNSNSFNNNNNNDTNSSGNSSDFVMNNDINNNSLNTDVDRLFSSNIILTNWLDIVYELFDQFKDPMLENCENIIIAFVFEPHIVKLILELYGFDILTKKMKEGTVVDLSASILKYYGPKILPSNFRDWFEKINPLRKLSYQFISNFFHEKSTIEVFNQLINVLNRSSSYSKIIPLLDILHGRNDFTEVMNNNYKKFFPILSHPQTLDVLQEITSSFSFYFKKPQKIQQDSEIIIKKIKRNRRNSLSKKKKRNNSDDFEILEEDSQENSITSINEDEESLNENEIEMDLKNLIYPLFDYALKIRTQKASIVRIRIEQIIVNILKRIDMLDENGCEPFFEHLNSEEEVETILFAISICQKFIFAFLNHLKKSQNDQNIIQLQKQFERDSEALIGWIVPLIDNSNLRIKRTAILIIAAIEKGTKNQYQAVLESLSSENLALIESFKQKLSLNSNNLLF